MASQPNRGDPRNEEYWRKYLSQPDSMLRFGRHVLSRLPSDPRCRLCTAPFAGAGAPFMRMIGKRPSTANPHVCTSCQQELIKHHGGAEVSGAMLFADIRGSTSLAERMSTAEFHALLERFYRVASQVVFAHDGTIDKFVGDELVAHFFPSFSGPRYVARAIEAAQALLGATGHGRPDGPWVPVGAGVNSGQAWFGAFGEGSHVELTAVGDAVNVAARLAGAAGPGEVLVGADAAVEAGLDPQLERRTLALKGKTEAVEVVVVRLADSVASGDRS